MSTEGNHICGKLEAKNELTEEEIMQLIVLPLTVKGKSEKLLMVEKSVNLAKKIDNEKQQVFALAGLLTFSDKIIDADYSNSVKEWIMMTKVARLFEEEKMEAVKKAKEEVTEAVTEELTKQMAIKLMNKGMQLEMIAEITGLSREEVKGGTLNYENI